MIVLISPSKNQIFRMTSTDGSQPKWFANPLMPVQMTRKLGDLISDYVSSLQLKLLIFNVDKLEALLSILPLPNLKICCLHQWMPLHTMPKWKQFIYNRLLLKSKVIATYSKLDAENLKSRYPKNKISWVGHFIDTNFFSPVGYIGHLPEKISASDSDYILCAGDHKRLEQIVSDISNTLSVKIVRFSTEGSVADFHKAHSPNVICLTGISFDEVRKYYANAKVVINAVDDRYFPVGITTFCEALAMNCKVITSGGHSCSGYAYEDGFRPYLTVDDIFNIDAWIEAIQKSKDPSNWESERTPRNLADKLCSLEAMQGFWKDVKTHLG